MVDAVAAQHHVLLRCALRHERSVYVNAGIVVEVECVAGVDCERSAFFNGDAAAHYYWP